MAVVLPEMLPDEAVTLVDPIPVAAANPVGLMPTIDGLPVAHCTDPVIIWVLPSVKVPVAASCKVVPSGNEGAGGVMASELRTAAVMVRAALPLTPENVAVMVVEPCAFVVATPALEIVAAVVFEELQLAELVRSLVVWSLYVPVALNC